MDNQITESETKPLKKLRWYEPETKIVWINVAIIMAINFGGLYYLIMFPYLEQSFLLIWFFLQCQITIFGITAGVHRLWSHRSYKANIPLRILLAIFFYSSVERFTIFDWVRNHRQHHKYSDTAADPHDTNRGFWYSHIGWVMLRKTDLVRERAKGIDMTDILNDPVVQFFDGNFLILKAFFVVIVPVLIPIYLFGQDVKWTLICHFILQFALEINVTGAVNSFAHMYGYRSYDKSIRPGENPLIALATLGEGWHNYHHVFPWDYKAAELKGFILNPTTFWIDMFAKINWAYDLKHPTFDHINSVAEKTGDGTHYTIPELTQDNQ